MTEALTMCDYASIRVFDVSIVNSEKSWDKKDLQSDAQKVSPIVFYLKGKPHCGQWHLLPGSVNRIAALGNWCSYCTVTTVLWRRYRWCCTQFAYMTRRRGGLGPFIATQEFCCASSNLSCWMSGYQCIVLAVKPLAWALAYSVLQHIGANSYQETSTKVNPSSQSHVESRTCRSSRGKRRKGVWAASSSLLTLWMVWGSSLRIRLEVEETETPSISEHRNFCQWSLLHVIQWTECWQSL